MKTKALSKGCKYCAERKKKENGRSYCPHIECPFEKEELEWWRNAGGKSFEGDVDDGCKRVSATN